MKGYFCPYNQELMVTYLTNNVEYQHFIVYYFIQFYMISGMESNLGPWFFKGFTNIFLYIRHTGIKTR